MRGFAITSYASQGKTVDHVLFSDSAIKAATNQQQWYVTISRGRKGITIFTSDKAQLGENIQRSGDRPLAMDLAKQRYFQSLGIPRRLWTRCLRNRAFAEGFRQSRLQSFTKLRGADNPTNSGNQGTMIRHGQDEGRRTSPCWEGDTKAQALRVELADGHACLVPYSRIAFVDCEYGTDDSTICLRTDTHEIRIVGKNLGGWNASCRSSRSPG